MLQLKTAKGNDVWVNALAIRAMRQSPEQTDQIELIVADMPPLMIAGSTAMVASEIIHALRSIHSPV